MKVLSEKSFFALFLLGLTVVANAAYGQTGNSLTRYVDPFIGTENGGHVFPGATLPFGMVKLGPDMGKNKSNSGYVSGAPVNGFSHVHVSGTGGGAKYGNILVMPYTGNTNHRKVSSSIDNETSSPGYYAATLDRFNIRAELTVTQRAGFHRYTFPASKNARILIDAGHFLSSSAPWNEDQELVGSEVKVVSKRVVKGYSRVRGGWNKGGAYTVYFYAIADVPADTFATWQGKEFRMGQKLQPDNGNPAGALLYYTTDRNEEVQLKVGISFVSTGKARQNVTSQISGWNFDTIRQQADKKWQRELERVDIRTDHEKYKQMFYTALYHSMLMPTDRTGENPEWTSPGVPYYDDYYAIWDTFRTMHPLLTLINPKRQVEMIQSLIDIYKNDRYMPDARSGNANGRTQGGSNSDVLIADAYVKGLKGIDYETALQAMLKNAEQPPGGNQQKHGRGGVSDYKELGYVSTDYERAGTRTMEYAYNDFCIAEVARGLGRDSLYRKFIKRSHNWKNLWNPNIKAGGVTGFIWPRKADGSWVKDFSTVRAGSWPNFFYESHSWEYSLYVPHDVAGLIDKSGGRKTFIRRLDTLFLETPDKEARVNYYYNVTNEPGFLSPTLYIWAGRPDLTNRRVRSIVEEHYGTGRAGLPGNDDSGAMSSWLAFNLMGIFPVAGQDLYVITAPHLSKVSINLQNGEEFVIEAKNLSDKNTYVRSATLNGKPLKRAWFRHTTIKKGGRLVLKMGSRPGDWGTEKPPPSLSTR